MSSHATAEQYRSSVPPRRIRLCIAVVAMTLAVDCTSPASMSGVVAETPSALADLPPGTHWIGVRASRSGGTELYDRRTNERFVPRGVDLLRAVHSSSGEIFDLLLDPSDYQATWVDEQLTQIAASGTTRSGCSSISAREPA